MLPADLPVSACSYGVKKIGENEEKEGKGKKANLDMKCTYLGTDSCNWGQIRDILGHTLQQNLGNLDQM